MPSKRNTQRPGEYAKKPGEYIEVGVRGGEVRGAIPRTIPTTDTKLPPPTKKGHRWKWIGKPNP